MTAIECPWCDAQHDDLLLCPPAKAVLDALYAAGTRYNMPTVEFSAPIHGAGMFGEGTVLLAQLVVKGATVPVAGIPRPALIFTGRDAQDRTLPSWIYPGAAADITAAARLVADMADMAIRAARTQAREDPV